jgi:hypothetical protein
MHMEDLECRSVRMYVFIGREYLNGRLQYTKCRKIGRVVHDVDSVRSIHVLRFHRDMSSTSRTKEFGSEVEVEGWICDALTSFLVVAPGL